MLPDPLNRYIKKTSSLIDTEDVVDAVEESTMDGTPGPPINSDPKYNLLDNFNHLQQYKACRGQQTPVSHSRSEKSSLCRLFQFQKQNH